MVRRSCWKSRHKPGSSCPVSAGFRTGLVALCLWLCATSSGCSGKVVQKDAEFDMTYNDTVTSDIQAIYAFNHTVSRNKTEGVRVSVDVQADGVEGPILFVVRQKQAVVSFQVPLILRGLYQRKYPYAHVGRTLCQPLTRAATETQFFFVDVSTLSSVGTHYQLRVSRVDSFTLQTDKKFSFIATPSQPQFFKYVFREGVDTVIVKVNSQMTFPCSVMSIQDILCPVYDLDNNVAFLGMYQTMTKTAAITVQRKDFPSNSFYVVVVVKTEDEACGGPLRFYPLRPDELIDAGNRSKVLDVVVSPAINSEVYVMGMLFCLGIFLSFYLLTFLMACVENKRMHRKRDGLLSTPDISPAETGKGLAPASPYEYGSFADNGSTLSSEAITDSITSADANYGYMERSMEHVGRARQESLSSVEEDDYDTLADVDSDKNIVRTKKYLCVSDLARKDKRVLSKKYQIYFWNIATIAVFYALPVIQLVITYQTVVNVTGNQDICYYNFLCAHPLGALSAFNNILSNLGYVMLGLLFLLIVLQRDIIHNRALMRNDLAALECGIPKHFGLFYAMGTALMMEGLLSACYHVCPNYTNFQFDTSFMYMIAGLCMLKLYQKRHPDINASAYTAYACLAAVIFFSVLGVVFGKGNTVFWVGFSIIHILATMLLSTQLYYMGRWRLDCGILRRVVYVIYTDCIRQCSGPMYIDRMVLLVMGNIVNWSLAAYGLIERPNDFASYLLAIAICNLLLYFAFYIIMKLRSGERIQCLALVCILFTAVVWGFALFFFFQGLSTWQKTPAESREHNRDCILLSFFDDHDIWHFLSSIAMFGSFLVLLTMDDDLDNNSLADTMSAAALQIGDQLILEEDYDESYIPSEHEILEYAREIGIDPEREPELMWLAREGIVAPLPAEWKPCQDVTGDVYYFNFSSGQSTWDHPCDEQYRHLVIQERERAPAHGGPVKKEKKKKKEKKEKKVKKGKEVVKAPTPLSSALGPLPAPLGTLAPLRGLSSAPIPSLRGSTGSSGGLEPLKTPLGASLSTLSSGLLGGRQEERVSLSLPGFEDEDEDEEEEEKVSENEFSRGTGRLLQNLHLDLDALGGGLQYEDSEASVSGPVEEKTDPELQDLALSPEHSPEPPSQDSLHGWHLHSSPLGGSRGRSRSAACPPTPGQRPPSQSQRKGDEEEGAEQEKDEEGGPAALEEVLDAAEEEESGREEEDSGAQSEGEVENGGGERERKGRSLKAKKEEGEGGVRAAGRCAEMADKPVAGESEEVAEEEEAGELANEMLDRCTLTEEEVGEESDEVIGRCDKSEAEEGSEIVERSLRSDEAVEPHAQSDREDETGGASESREGGQGGAGEEEEEEEIGSLGKKEGSEQEEEEEEEEEIESLGKKEDSEASEHIEAASSSDDDPKAGFRSKLLENVLDLEDLSPVEPAPPLNTVSVNAQPEGKEKEEERRKRAEAAERRLLQKVEPSEAGLTQSSKEEAPGVEGRGREEAVELRRLKEETEKEVAGERVMALWDREERLRRLREELRKEEGEEEQRLKEENKERVRTLRQRLQAEKQGEESRLRQEAELRLQELQESELRERENQEHKLREEGAARLQELREALEAEREAEKQKLEERRRQEVQRLQQDADNDLRAERLRLQKEREEQLEPLRAERRSSESRVEVRSPRQEQHVAEYQRELGDMLQEVREEVQREHSRKLEQLREEHRSELESIREKHLEEERLQGERFLSELQEERSRLLASHSSQLEELRSQLDSRLQEMRRTHTQKENELQELGQLLELRAKEMKTQNAILQAQAEDLRKKREQLGDEEGEVERGMESLPRILEERDALREEVERAREENRRLKEKNDRLENKAELLQGRCDQLCRRVSELQLSESRKQASPKQQGDEGRWSEREGKRKEKRKEKETPTVPPTGQEEALQLEDLEPPPAASTPPLSRDSESSLDDVRQYISSEGVSLQKARRFLETQSGSLSQRQAALRAARTNWAQDPSRDTATQDLFSNLQQEASHLEQLKATVQRGQTLLRRKEERLTQLETSLQEELSDDDDDVRETAGKRVTFEASESELSSFDALDGAGSHPTVPAKVQQLADSLQHISGQLNTVLGALGTLAHRQTPVLPPYTPLPFSLSRPPASIPTPSSAWAPPTSGALSRGLGDTLGGRWGKLFHGGAMEANVFHPTGSHSVYSAYTPASADSVRSLSSKQPVSVEVDGQRLQARINETKRWLESRRKESSVPLLTRYRNPPSMRGLVQLSLDENNQIKVYHY
ncbi:hypothetical protein SKAU_G00090700 [Synaphobranchus kaupii]|uniref:Centrosomal protein of 164 kDa n=1 Tax=Synaphobranchus kaupii TaxID=118154 RepID=A0A9Q1FWS2_SYNKA|nr:hypothetical protein SKAU_G00090700 [Synaphobranchus kaupii]